MIDFASLLPIIPYGVAFLVIGLALRQIARWSDGASFADHFGGYRDLPWPHGVQEEEPPRWDMTRLRGRARPVAEVTPRMLANDCAGCTAVRN